MLLFFHLSTFIGALGLCSPFHTGRGRHGAKVRQIHVLQLYWASGGLSALFKAKAGTVSGPGTLEHSSPCQQQSVA